MRLGTLIPSNAIPDAMIRAFDAGADIVVIGNHFEQHPDEIEDFVRIKQEQYDKSITNC